MSRSRGGCYKLIDFEKRPPKKVKGPFRLTCAIARARVSTRANLSACAICCTHEKSLVYRIFFFQSFVYVYEHHL